jgi:DNA-binding transcriptional LysR family regulator
MIRDDIDNGPLVALDMADAPPGDYQLHAIYRADTPPGPAASWLIERMLTEV